MLLFVLLGSLSLKVQAEMSLLPFRLPWLCPCGDTGSVDREFVEPVA